MEPIKFFHYLILLNLSFIVYCFFLIKEVISTALGIYLGLVESMK